MQMQADDDDNWIIENYRQPPSIYWECALRALHLRAAQAHAKNYVRYAERDFGVKAARVKVLRESVTQ